jgi:hypothetical protein
MIYTESAVNIKNCLHSVCRISSHHDMKHHVTSRPLLQVTRNVSTPVQCVHGRIAPVLHMMGVIVQNKEHHEMHGGQIDHNETAVQKLKEEMNEALVQLFALCADSKRVFNKNYATAL